MRLKELRTKLGVTQKEVAKAIICTPTVYSRYEREEREPNIETLILLANYLKTTVDYLIGRTDK